MKLARVGLLLGVILCAAAAVLVVRSVGGRSAGDPWRDPLPRFATRRLGTARLLHPNWGARKPAWSADGRVLVTAGAPGEALVSDGATGRTLGRFQIGRGTFAVSPDGRHLAVSGERSTVLHALPQGAPLSRTQVAGEVGFTRDGATLVIAGSEAVWRWGLGDAPPLRVGELGAPLGTAIDGAAERVAAVGRDGRLRILDARSGQALVDVAWVRASQVAFSEDGRRLVAEPYGVSKEVRFLDATTGTVLRTLQFPWCRRTPTLSPDGRLLVASDHDGAEVVDVETGERRALGHGGGDAAFSPSGDRLALLEGGRVRLLDASAGFQEPPALVGHSGSVVALAFTPDGDTLVSGSVDGTVRAWDLRKPDASPRIVSLPPRHATTPVHVAIGQGGALVVVTEHSGGGWTPERGGRWRPRVVRTLEWPSGRLVAEAEGREWDGVAGLALAPGSGFAHVERDGAVVVRRPDGSETSRVALGDGDHALALTPAGDLLAAALADGSVALLDVSTGSTVGTLAGHPRGVTRLAFSASGSTLASAAGREVRTWDVAPRQLRATLTLSEASHALAVSPDGGLVATGHLVSADPYARFTGDEVAVRLWDGRTGVLLAELTGHLQPCRSLAFSPDGATLASGADDNTVLLWDVRAAVGRY